MWARLPIFVAQGWLSSHTQVKPSWRPTTCPNRAGVSARIESLNGCLSVVKGGKAVSILLVPGRRRDLLRIDAGEIFALNSTAVLLAAAESARTKYPLNACPPLKVAEHCQTDLAGC